MAKLGEQIKLYKKPVHKLADIVDGLTINIRLEQIEQEKLRNLSVDFEIFVNSQSNSKVTKSDYYSYDSILVNTIAYENLGGISYTFTSNFCFSGCDFIISIETIINEKQHVKLLESQETPFSYHVQNVNYYVGLLKKCLPSKDKVFSEYIIDIDRCEIYYLKYTYTFRVGALCQLTHQITQSVKLTSNIDQDKEELYKQICIRIINDILTKNLFPSYSESLSFRINNLNNELFKQALNGSMEGGLANLRRQQMPSLYWPIEVPINILKS